jgi:hypothetical protein
MIWAGRFKKLLEVIRGQPRLVLKIRFGRGNELLVGVTDVLVIITLIATSGDCDSLGPPLCPPLTAHDAHLCSLVGYYGRRSPTTARGCLPIALHKDGPDCLLARGVPGGDVEELLRCLWMFTVELMHQILVGCARLECRYNVGIADLGEFVAFFMCPGCSIHTYSNNMI